MYMAVYDLVYDDSLIVKIINCQGSKVTNYFLLLIPKTTLL